MDVEASKADMKKSKEEMRQSSGCQAPIQSHKKGDTHQQVKHENRQAGSGAAEAAKQRQPKAPQSNKQDTQASKENMKEDNLEQRQSSGSQATIQSRRKHDTGQQGKNERRQAGGAAERPRSRGNQGCLHTTQFFFNFLVSPTHPCDRGNFFSLSMYLHWNYHSKYAKNQNWQMAQNY